MTKHKILLDRMDGKFAVISWLNSGSLKVDFLLDFGVFGKWLVVVIELTVWRLRLFITNLEMPF